MVLYGETLASLNTATSNILFKPAIYDELEFFKESGMYPFNKRKNSLPSIINGNSDKYMKIHSVNLRKNEVCFNKNYLSELLFWRDEKCEEPEDFQYKKFKFESSTIETEKKVFTQYMGMVVGLDSQK